MPFVSPKDAVAERAIEWMVGRVVETSILLVFLAFLTNPSSLHPSIPKPTAPFLLSGSSRIINPVDMCHTAGDSNLELITGP